MATLKSSVKIQKFILVEESGTKWYDEFLSEYKPQRWQELQNILSAYGIKISSKYDVEFEDDAYRLEMLGYGLGETKGKIFYGSTLIAEGWIEGSNYCDREARVQIYMNRLKSVYKA